MNTRKRLLGSIRVRQREHHLALTSTGFTVLSVRHNTWAVGVKTKVQSDVSRSARHLMFGIVLMLQAVDVEKPDVDW